jgi:hypothetical protein
MKRCIAFALLLAIGAPAQAKLTPHDRTAVAPSATAEDAVMYAGPIGAMLETDYFRAPPAKFGGSSSCRAQPYRPDGALPHACE